MAGQMNGSDSVSDSRDDTSAVGVGDVPPRGGSLLRAIGERIGEKGFFKSFICPAMP
jgi:hypothetical protein